MPHCFGIVGHGVVGSRFSQLLSGHGARVLSYDRLLDRAETAAPMRNRIESDGSEARNLDEVLAASEHVLSLVPPQSCRQIADRVSRGIEEHQVFVDLTSTSPAVKRAVAATVAGSGAPFVEGVILGAVNASSCPAILLAGPAAEHTAAVFERHGLPARFYSPEIGRASTFKMLRSIFSKGVEAVLVETLVAARRAGLEEEIWSEILATLGSGKLESAFQNWVRSHARSAQRRCFEMQEVSEFLGDLGIRGAIPRAAGDVFARSFELGVTDAFSSEPDSFREVIAYLERQSSAAGTRS